MTLFVKYFGLEMSKMILFSWTCVIIITFVGEIAVALDHRRLMDMAVIEVTAPPPLQVSPLMVASLPGTFQSIENPVRQDDKVPPTVFIYLFKYLGDWAIHTLLRTCSRDA